jgi:hypothetical protein
VNVEAFLLCDAATDTHGKLNVLGAFDSIFVRSVPAVHQNCAIVLRLRMSRSEAGEHKVAIHFVDEDGNYIVKPLEGSIRVGAGNELTSATNLILHLQGLKLPRFGELAINLIFDDEPAATVPLHVRPVPGAQPEAPQN